MQADMPDWLCQRLAAQYGEADALTIARSLQQSAPLDLRVNILKATRDEVAQRFASEQSAAIELTPYSPHGIRMPQKMNISRHPLFTDGKHEVRDESSKFFVQLRAEASSVGKRCGR